MYIVLEATVATLTLFLPLFIAMRDRTNANWRSLQA